MKRQFKLFFVLVMIGFTASAQKEYKLAKSSGKLNLNISSVTLEGYNGSEIIFSSAKSENERVDERAKGLRAINSSGFSDNTGLGLDVTVKGEEINVNPVSINNQRPVRIKVPQNIKVSFTNNSNIYQDTITLKNLKNEVEVSVSYNGVKLENNTGPMNIKTLYGAVDASFQDDIKGPISIVSVYGHVDVAMPKSAKVDLEAGTNYGKIYAADAFNIAIEKEDKTKEDKNKPVVVTGYGTSIAPASNVTVINGLASTGTGKTSIFTATNSGDRIISAINFGMRKESENIKGKINGGGTKVILKSNHDSIYLREK